MRKFGVIEDSEWSSGATVKRCSEWKIKIIFMVLLILQLGLKNFQTTKLPPYRLAGATRNNWSKNLVENYWQFPSVVSAVQLRRPPLSKFPNTPHNNNTPFVNGTSTFFAVLRPSLQNAKVSSFIKGGDKRFYEPHFPPPFFFEDVDANLFLKKIVWICVKLLNNSMIVMWA